MMHTYRSTEATSCLAGRRIVFIGGLNTHSVFQGVAAKLDPEYKIPAVSREGSDMMQIADVRSVFVWDPKLESTEMKQITAGFDDLHERPALTVIGLSYEQLKQQEDLTTWAAQVGGVLSQLRSDAPGRLRQSDKIVVVPMFEPNVTQLSAADQKLITPARVHSINEAVTNMSEKYGIDVAFAFNRVLQGPGALSDGITPTGPANAVLADILLNLRCNTELPQRYPFANTCCNHYPRPSWVQLAGFAFVALLVPLAWYLYSRGYTPDSSAILRWAPASKYHVPILVMGFTVVLCYYCDRTNILGKEQKQTSPAQFFLGMGVIILLSLYTLKTSDKDLAFLNRDQTDEWKGWMQVAILVYHYVGVSKTPYIYQYMRVCPTSYLFMTGFGHTVYFLKKDDYSLKRFVATMLRLNLLNVILAYAMGNDWLLYYFAPLVTWNFFVIYGLLWVGHKHNKNLKFLFSKMVIAALLNTAFYRVPGVMEFVWGILQLLFRMQGDMREWRFRVTLDQYSVFPGMVGAILFINWSSYSLPKSASWPKIEKIAIFVSVAIMLGYAVFETAQPTKVIYNQKHPYVSWLPCCAFVVLRNCTPWLRRTHNGFFAWVGRGSLETFLLQFHIWLAADTVGLLTIGPADQRTLNFVLTTVVFFWVSSHVTQCTGAVIEWVMGAEPKPAHALPMTAVAPARQANTSSEKMPAALQENGVGNVGSAVPVNGQPSNINVQDPEKLNATVEEIATRQPTTMSGLRGRLSMAGKDLRVRVFLMLGAMAVMNWVSRVARARWGIVGRSPFRLSIAEAYADQTITDVLHLKQKSRHG